MAVACGNPKGLCPIGTELGYSPIAKIPTLAAYERARRVLRGVCEPNAAPLTRHRARSRGFGAKGKKKRPSGDGRFSLAKGYEKDIFRELPLGFELKRIPIPCYFLLNMRKITVEMITCAAMTMKYRYRSNKRT